MNATSATQANAAYLALRPIASGEAAESVSVQDRHGTVVLVIDFSTRGEVPGIEFLDAEQQLPESSPKR